MLRRMSTTTPAPAGSDSRMGERPRLVLASFLMLFAELALIRWVSAYVIYVAYFTNFVLLASFLGIGLGFLRAGRQRDLSVWAPAALGTVALVVIAFPVEVLRNTGGRAIAGLHGLPAIPMRVELPVIFLGVVFAMACISEGVARYLRAVRTPGGVPAGHPGEPLGHRRVLPVVVPEGRAARVGTRAGRPVPCFGAAETRLAAPRLHRTRRRRVRSGGGVLTRHVVSLLPRHRRADDGAGTHRHHREQPAASVDDAAGPLATSQPFYGKPYTHLAGNPLDDVLVVGAGNGNDVALALAHGAKHVDAVEIDPVIQAAGRDLHPARPYQDPRVTAHIDDGRAFLERTDTRYDLILFALPDSLTLVSGQGSLRLESYLFTLEAMQSVRDHLKPGGAFAMYNYYTPFVFERYANTMRLAFGHEPCFDPGARISGLAPTIGAHDRA